MKLLPIFLVASFAAFIADHFTPNASAATTHDVQIINYSFSPANVTIDQGDSVRWTQSDSFTAHTTTSGNAGTADGIWDSGFLGTGDVFVFTFHNAGSYPYYCAYHTFMNAAVAVNGAPNTPPTVSIASPTNGATFTTASNITIQASANDSDGNVAQVEFFDGTNSLGLSTGPSFSVTVNLGPGSHTLTAVATDNLGATTTSATVTINVNTVPIADPIPFHIVKGSFTVELETVADGINSPVSMTVPDDGTSRMFISDQMG
ncbi:MAG TPA: Ig-like domain-containing protein, partial [Verrucomicrobiae bacterium]